MQLNRHDSYMELPAAFIDRTRPLLGDEWDDFRKALQETPPPTSIRLNDKTPLRIGTAVPWCPDGAYLDERPLFTLDPLFHAGCYYVQEASSMFVRQALQQCVPPGSLVLDLCAAPGGKSTLISQYLGDKGFLVANEIIRQRAHILAENLQKWGNGNFAVTNDTPQNIGKLTALFDAILVDAPCSGEGMFRKDPGAIAEWSEANVRMCAARQWEILADVWAALKPGGVLIYSTCTYNREENEDNVQWICTHLGASYQPLSIDTRWQLSGKDAGYHFYPHKTRGEGFFLAVMRKHGGAARTFRLRDKNAGKQQPAGLRQLREWLDGRQEWKMEFGKNRAYAIPEKHTETVRIIQECLNVITAGTELAEWKAGKWIPGPAAALSKYLNRQNFTTFAADTETALAFLRTETLNLPELPLGYVLITYKDVPLGWVKNVGNRCNNLYPNEWRIRKK